LLVIGVNWLKEIKAHLDFSEKKLILELRINLKMNQKNP